MAVEALVLLCTTIRIELWSASPWVAAAPGVGKKVRKTKSSSRHGILMPANLSNCLANPNTQAALIKTNVMMCRSSQQKDSGGGGGGGGGMFEWYADVVGVMHVQVIV
jgi:hypothetical protein